MVLRPDSQATQYESLPLVEPLEDYRPGGFHPIHLGDKLDRYIILNKLGYGVSSTVWLARDPLSDEAVALSVLMSEVSRATAQRQLAIQHYLSRGDPSHPGHSTMLVPMHDFEIDGPNGNHSCFVTPVMGPSIGVATKRGQGVAARGLPLYMAKRAVLDLASGIAYMTSQGVVHGDLHPSNLLLQFTDEVARHHRNIADLCGQPRTTPVVRTDGQSVPENVPKYGVEPAFLEEFDPSLFSGHIKISDFGESFLMASPPRWTIAQGPFILPEFASPKYRTPAIDVWMFGAAVFQIISGRDMFGIVGDPTKLVLTRFMETLGRPPSFFIEDWNHFLNEDLSVSEFPQRPLSIRVNEIREGNSALGMVPRHEDFTLEDIEVLTGFLSRLLRYAPAERARMVEILQSSDMAYFKESTTGM